MTAASRAGGRAATRDGPERERREEQRRSPCPRRAGWRRGRRAPGRRVPWSSRTVERHGVVRIVHRDDHDRYPGIGPAPATRTEMVGQIATSGGRRRGGRGGTVWPSRLTRVAAQHPEVQTPAMRSFAHRHPIRTFLAIVYTATAAIFAIPLLSNAGLGVIDLDLPGAAPFILLSAMSLVIAAFVTTALADGRAGVRELRSRVFRFRVSPRWYVIAFVALPGAALATAFVLAGAVAGRRPRVRSVHRPQRRPRRGHRLRAHQLVGRGRLDRLRAPPPPAPHRPGPRQRRHDLDAGRAPPAARVHRGRRHDRARRTREHPVLPRRPVHPADPGPHDADLDLQRERPKRADRGPVPRRPGRRRRGRVPAPHRADRRPGHGLRGLRGPRPRWSSWPPGAGSASRRSRRRWSSAGRSPSRPDLAPASAGRSFGIARLVRCPGSARVR